MNDEIWRVIENFPDYKVSNKGRLRSSKMGYLHFLNPMKTKSGYYIVDLQGKIKYVHLLVLEAFVRPRPEGCVGNHKDGIKTNNTLKNLEWITHTEDMKHAFKLRLSKSPWQNFGEKAPAAKLKDGEVWLIKRLLWFKYYHKKIAEMFKVTRSVITLINRERTWQQTKFEPLEKDKLIYKKLFNMEDIK